MTATPALSVIMPVYNGERLVSQAVDSILGQTFSDFEFIVVDDGSTDSTAAILECYARADPRVRICAQPRNIGITESRNAGCRLARGELLAVMDADDISLPTRFARQVEFLRNHPDVAAVGTRVQLVSDSGVRGRIMPVLTEPGLVAWSLLFLNSIAHPSMMFRRCAVDMNQVYDPALPVSEDYDLVIRISHRARVANLGEVLLLYRTWAGNISKTANLYKYGAEALSRRLHDIGVAVSPEQANVLLGLSIDRFPASTAAITDVARCLESVRDVYVRTVARTEADRSAMRGDLASRLWLLAALAARVSPPLAVSLAARAVATSAFSIFPFTAKVGRRLFARAS